MGDEAVYLGGVDAVDVKVAVSVVMPTHNREALLGRVLEAYDRQEGDVPFELVAADDASTDGTRDLLESYRPRRYRLDPLFLDRNGGPGRARNEALRRARGHIALIVGDDIMPSRNLVAEHHAAHARLQGEHWAILGRTTWPDDLPLNSLMRHIDGVGAQQFSYSRMRDGQELDFRHFYTSNVSIKRSLLARVEPWFDPVFVHAAYEDVELAYRLSRTAGLRIRYVSSAHATHYHPYGTEAFAARQYRCGLMASVLLRKHPELRPRWRTDRLRRLRVLSAVPPLRGFLERLDVAEEEKLERLATSAGTACENREGTWVDRIYLVLLEYFVLKGLIEGELGRQAARPRRALLLFGLVHHMGAVLASAEAKVLSSSSDGAALLAAAGHYDRVRRGWPRALRWPLLSPVRSMVLPR
jgi:glycosyltransferase involved in cell wall biosynthesis